MKDVKIDEIKRDRDVTDGQKVTDNRILWSLDEAAEFQENTKHQNSFGKKQKI